MILRRGSKGADVVALQLKLKAAGYYKGGIDGDFGPLTESAVYAFQLDRPDIDDDKIAGPMTLGALDSAIELRVPRLAATSFGPPANDAAWQVIWNIAEQCALNARYGPGRGLFVGDRWVVTQGPGALGRKAWASALGYTFPSFHCTSLVNFGLSLFYKRNEKYTHAGNIPSAFQLCDLIGPQNFPGGGPYLPFGDELDPLAPDGAGAARTGIPNTIDARELLERARADVLPTMMVFAQSTLARPGVIANSWHHVGFFFSWKRELYRWAADGRKDAQGRYSGDPVRMARISDANVGNFSKCAYKLFGAKTNPDGSYGPPDRPIARVEFER